MDLYQCEVCGRQEGVNEMFTRLGVKVLLPKGPKPLVMRVGG